jgi:FlaG/FlaF family flagellin (archaellin)
MSIRPVIGGAAAVAIALSLSAIAQSGMQGTVTEVQDGGRKVVLKTSDGKMTTVGVSGSRTKVTIAGKPANRDNIKVGMSCTAVGAEAADATGLDCK